MQLWSFRESQSTERAVRLRVESRKEQPEGARRGAGRERPESAPELRCNHGGAGGKGRNPRAPVRAQGAGPGLPYTGPPLITFSGPLPAGADNAGGAFEVRKRCRGGRQGTLLPSPVLPMGRRPAGQNWNGSQPGPRNERDKGKTNRFGAKRTVLCLSPAQPSRDDGWLQPACSPAGQAPLFT